MDSSQSENDDPANVSEEAILDSLFYACDTEHSGRVSVSKLIDYLRNAVSNGTEEFAGNLDDLSLIWDPDGMDMEIDLTSFQEGIKEWISEIRKRSFANVEDDHHSSPVTVNCMDSATPRPYGSPERIKSLVTSTHNASSDSVEGLGGKSPDKDWPSELISTIEKLQLNNRRLIEQHSAIQAQLESAEELNGQLSAEVESLRKQLRSYQLMIDKSKEKEKENTELRQAVSDALEANQSLQTKIVQLEKERSSYENNVNEIGEKLLEAQGQVELLDEERRQLINDLAEQKQYCTDLQEIQCVKNDMIAKESSTNSSMIVGLATENETLKMEKSRLETRILDLEENMQRLHRNELLAEKSKLAQNEPVLNSTPFSRQSSLQQELEAQETCETKGLPSPIVGSQFSFSDSLDGDDLDVSLTGINQSWLSSFPLDSTSTSSSFEKYSMTAFQMANEFKEKKERALRQIDELAALDRSVEVKDKKEVVRDQLAQDLDSYAEKVASLCIKKKVAEKRTMKLLAATKKLKDENKQLSEERGKAYQKLGTMALYNDEMSARLLEFESRLENRTKTVAQQSEEMAFLEQQLSNVTEDLFKTREEKENVTRSLANEKRLSSSLELELVSLKKSQDELDKEQLLLLVKIKELESELGKTTTQLNMEKRRTANLEESIQLSVSRHSDELRNIFDSIPATDTEALNRSRQSPRASSPCITGHMVKAKLFDFVSHVDTSKVQGVDSNSSEGGDCRQTGASSILSESLSPKHGGQELYGMSESPSGKFLQLVDNGERDLTATASQTDFQGDVWWNGSQTDALKKFKMIDLKDFTSTGSQTDLLREIEVMDLKDLVSTGSQTDLLRDIDELIVVDKAESTEKHPSRERRRRSGVTESPVVGDRTIETAIKPDSDGLKSNSEAVDSGKLSLAVEKERKATNLWRKKLSVAFKFPEEFESYSSATGQALENSVGSSNFVDGVSLHVSPAPNEKEIEKQFKTLVLAFHTDHDTLSRRLEVQARARDMAESNMNKELQNLSNSLKEFEQLCFTRDMQDMLSLLKSQVEVLKTSSKRMSTQSEQHGCVQQEARMSSGVEVMICHAENLSRHLERVREDLDELRHKERLAADEPVTSGPLANGATRYVDSQRSQSASGPLSPPDKPDEVADGAKQNSLLNFVMAFHTTSMRAKEALKNFRRRSGVGSQERSASAAPRLQTDEPAPATEINPDRETTAPEVVVNDTEEEKGRDMEGAAIEGEAVVTEVPLEIVADEEGLVSSGPTESSENDSQSEVEEFESQERHSSQTPKRPGVCWRYFSAAFRLTVSFVILMVLLVVGFAILDGHSTIKIDTYFISSKVRKVLEPVAQLVYNIKPPE